MTTPLRLGAHERLTVISSEPDSLVVQAQYDGGGTPPPTHFHPAQDETFDVLTGSLHVEVDGQASELPAGSSLTIRRGQVHRMWNAGSAPATVRWRTDPPLATLAWFRGVDALQRKAEQAGKQRPAPLGFLAHAARNRDRFRLVLGGSAALGTVLTVVLGGIGRLVGR